jgi:hypothetical protein
VTGTKIVDGTITTAKIAALQIVTSLIAVGAVTATEILDGTITAAELAADCVTAAKILDETVGTAELAALCVTTAKLAALCVTTTEIANGAVTMAKLAEKVGNYSGTTNGTNDLVVTHSAGFTPSQVFVQSVTPSGGANQGYPVVTALAATTFTLRYLNSAGSCASLAVSGYWRAIP